MGEMPTRPRVPLPAGVHAQVAALVDPNRDGGPNYPAAYNLIYQWMAFTPG